MDQFEFHEGKRQDAKRRAAQAEEARIKNQEPGDRSWPTPQDTGTLDPITLARAQAVLADERRRGGGPPETMSPGNPQGLQSAPGPSTYLARFDVTLSMSASEADDLVNKISYAIGSETPEQEQMIRRVLWAFSKVRYDVPTPRVEPVTSDRPEWQR